VKSSATIYVVAGALFDASGRVLIAQRPPGKHMAGGWEFPGGKRGDNESPLQALTRELKEELSIGVCAAQQLIAYTHEYPDRSVLLDLWLVSKYDGEPISAEGQPIKWVSLPELETVGLLEADRPMIEALRKAMGQ
jgi:8-oxo-dGTP diphosphatase